MNIRLQPNTNPAKNVILFLGDGMGISTTTAARIFDGQSRGESGEENVLSWETFPYTALSKTYNTDVQVPDSAGTATAFGTGVKTREGILGLNGKAIFENCASAKGNEVLSILTFAELAGMSTGLITNTRVTHATPGAFYSHTPSRNWENDQSAQGTCVDISRQLIEYQYGNGIDVVLGGGWRSFLPCGSKDPEGKTFEDLAKCRNDGRNLTNEWLGKYNNSAVVWNKDELKKIDPDQVDHLLGLFASSVMEYEVLRPEKNRSHEPNFIEMVEKTIEILRKNPKGFFLMAEGGLIDWAHHDNNAHLSLSETASMAKAVKKVQDMTNADETLILVTADHSHSFTQFGNVKRGNPIFGFQSKLPLDGKPALSLSYADGPTGLIGNQTRANLTGANYNDTGFLQQALIKMEYESHSAEDVGQFFYILIFTSACESHF
ncbi:alkaline phosphatase-like isoform X1 [Paramuricea clavata]|uniref:Alkaline phosphatase n=1 Tax=Paramuricea clavata TaxID=317549 RepID=A0A6S7FRH9_PARCT|nr:alkaline phosphatase-like isoform X1 [Paramuricea clavata]